MSPLFQRLQPTSRARQVHEGGLLQGEQGIGQVHRPWEQGRQRWSNRFLESHFVQQQQ